jgi:hypothetical protein
MAQNGLWGSQPGWATSFGAALNNYSGGGGISEGMVTGYFRQAWQGTGRENIRASFAGGQNAGKGFIIGFTMATNSTDKGCTLANALVASMFMTNERIMELFQNGSGKSGGGDGGLGNWLSGFDLAVGVYSQYGHNHTTYKTTKGIEKNIYKGNGQIRSARAAGFARASNFIKGVAVVGSIASTAYSGYKVANQFNNGGIQNVNGWDATDAGVGTLGLVATGVVTFGLTSNPVGWGILATGAMIYSGVRFVYGIYDDYIK